MKTSILISSIAALCLLLTFAEAPRRNDDNKMNADSPENISITGVMKATMLPGVTITAIKKNETGISIPVLPTGDFSYLKFELSDFISDSELGDYEITELPENENSSYALTTPEPVLNEFGYLRFDVNDYICISQIGTVEFTELPSEEIINVNQPDKPTPDMNTIEFGYLKFNVSEYYSPDSQADIDEYELPEK